MARRRTRATIRRQRRPRHCLGGALGRLRRNTLDAPETLIFTCSGCPASKCRLDRAAMMNLFGGLFRRRDAEISEAGTRDAAVIAGLHSAAFHRGWSESELESLLLDRSVVAHRAMRGRKLVGFILSRLAADEAEILSIAVACSQRSRGLGRRLLDRKS